MNEHFDSKANVFRLIRAAVFHWNVEVAQPGLGKQFAFLPLNYPLAIR